MAMVQITLLGCGKMGSAMLKGWLADPGLNAQFTIIEPYAEHLGWARAQQQVTIYSDCDAAIAAGAPVSAMIVLAVKPQIMDEAIAAAAKPPPIPMDEPQQRPTASPPPPSPTPPPPQPKPPIWG